MTAPSCAASPTSRASSLSSQSAFFCILYQPFAPWKHAERNLREARERGFETVVAWDHRNTRSDYERIRTLADTVVPFRSNGHCEEGYMVLKRVRSDFALMIADDEIPSEPLWDFAENPTSVSRFCVPVVPIVGERMHTGHIGVDERLIWLDGWNWVPRQLMDGNWTTFEGRSVSPVPQIWLMLAEEDGRQYNPGLLIWHYLLESPVEDREEKLARYTRLDPSGDHRTRLFPKEEELIPIPSDMLRYLPKEKNDEQRENRQQSDHAPAPAGG